MRSTEGNGRNEVLIRNRQRRRPIPLGRLRQAVMFLLEEEWRLGQSDIGIHFVNDAEMTRLNETYLQHAGSTDVITFDYMDGPDPARLQGDIFIGADQAAAHARRYRVTWRAELMRYVIHGLLHLRGYDDAKAAARRRMKREENRLLRRVLRLFPLWTAGERPKLRRR